MSKAGKGRGGPSIPMAPDINVQRPSVRKTDSQRSAHMGGLTAGQRSPSSTVPGGSKSNIPVRGDESQRSIRSTGSQRSILKTGDSPGLKRQSSVRIDVGRRGSVDGSKAAASKSRLAGAAKKGKQEDSSEGSDKAKTDSLKAKALKEPGVHHHYWYTHETHKTHQHYHEFHHFEYFHHHHYDECMYPPHCKRRPRESEPPDLSDNNNLTINRNTQMRLDCKPRPLDLSDNQPGPPDLSENNNFIINKNTRMRPPHWKPRRPDLKPHPPDLEPCPPDLSENNNFSRSKIVQNNLAKRYPHNGQTSPPSTKEFKHNNILPYIGSGHCMNKNKMQRTLRQNQTYNMPNVPGHKHVNYVAKKKYTSKMRCKDISNVAGRKHLYGRKYVAGRKHVSYVAEKHTSKVQCKHISVPSKKKKKSPRGLLWPWERPGVGHAKQLKRGPQPTEPNNILVTKQLKGEPHPIEAKTTLVTKQLKRGPQQLKRGPQPTEANNTLVTHHAGVLPQTPILYFYQTSRNNLADTEQKGIINHSPYCFKLPSLNDQNQSPDLPRMKTKNRNVNDAYCKTIPLPLPDHFLNQANKQPIMQYKQKVSESQHQTPTTKHSSRSSVRRLKPLGDDADVYNHNYKHSNKKINELQNEDMVSKTVRFRRTTKPHENKNKNKNDENRNAFDGKSKNRKNKTASESMLNKESRNAFNRKSKNRKNKTASETTLNINTNMDARKRKLTLKPSPTSSSNPPGQLKTSPNQLKTTNTQVKGSSSLLQSPEMLNINTNMDARKGKLTPKPSPAPSPSPSGQLTTSKTQVKGSSSQLKSPQAPSKSPSQASTSQSSKASSSASKSSAASKTPTSKSGGEKKKTDGKSLTQHHHHHNHVYELNDHHRHFHHHYHYIQQHHHHHPYPDPNPEKTMELAIAQLERHRTHKELTLSSLEEERMLRLAGFPEAMRARREFPKHTKIYKDQMQEMEKRHQQHLFGTTHRGPRTFSKRLWMMKKRSEPSPY